MTASKDRGVFAVLSMVQTHRDPSTLENLEMTVDQVEGTGDPQNKIEGEGIFVRKDGTDPGKMIKSKKRPAARHRETVG